MSPSPDAAIVFVLLGAAIVLFVLEVLRVDVVAVLLVLALIAAGVLDPTDAFLGFGSETTVFLAGLFVMSGGLVKTGVVERIALALRASVRGHPSRLAPACVGTVAAVSAFVSNTVTVALFVPVVNALSRRGGMKPGQVLMPIAYASMLGGVCTVVGTSTNVLVSGLLRRMGHEPYGVFTTAAVGVPALVLGMCYLLVVAPRLLKRRGAGAVAEDYAIRSYLGEVIVEPRSTWVGRSLSELKLSDQGIEVLGVVRAPLAELRPLSPDEPFEAGDLVLLKGSSQDILALTSVAGVTTVADQGQARGAPADLVLGEFMVAPGSTLVGHTLKEARFRQRFGAAAIALYRHGAALHQKVGRIRLHVGDILLVQGSRGSAETLAEDSDLIQLEDVSHHRARSRRSWVALAVFAGFLLVGMGTGHLAVAALGGAALMVATGCITPEEAYEFADWRLLVLVGGMLSVAFAMQDTGAAAWLAHQLVGAVGPFGIHALLATFFVLTVVLTQAMSNQAAAAVIVPVALGAAIEAGLPVRPMAITVTVAASCAFLTPLEPASVLVYGPGRYRFRDFALVGAPLTLMVLVLTVILVPWIWPLP